MIVDDVLQGLWILGDKHKDIIDGIKVEAFLRNEKTYYRIYILNSNKIDEQIIKEWLSKELKVPVEELHCEIIVGNVREYLKSTGLWIWGRQTMYLTPIEFSNFANIEIKTAEDGVEEIFKDGEYFGFIDKDCMVYKFKYSLSRN